MFHDISSAAAPLVGIAYRADGRFRALQPIYLGKKGPVDGLRYGNRQEAFTGRVVARKGYVVGAVVVEAFGAVNGIQLIFMRYQDGQLDANDSYESPWVGGHTNRRTTLSGDGQPIIGLRGSASKNEVHSLGLIVHRPDAAKPGVPRRR